MNQLSSGKALGGCVVYCEMLRAGKSRLLVVAHSLVHHLDTGINPTDWGLALSFRSEREKVTPRSPTTTAGYLPLYARLGLLTNSFSDRVRRKLITHQRHE